MSSTCVGIIAYIDVSGTWDNVSGRDKTEYLVILPFLSSFCPLGNIREGPVFHPDATKNSISSVQETSDDHLRTHSVRRRRFDRY